jgi:hypothetical protein
VCQSFNGLDACLLKRFYLCDRASGVIYRESVKGDLSYSQFQTQIVYLESWLNAEFISVFLFKSSGLRPPSIAVGNNANMLREPFKLIHDGPLEQSIS